MQPIPAPASLYAGLGLEDLLGGSYLGLDMSELGFAANMPPDAAAAAIASSGGMQVAMPQQQVLASSLPGANAIASITPKNDVGMRRAEIRQGVRQIQLAKDQGGKLGFAVRSIDKGVFVSFVWNHSAASMGGLRFGDQILQIDGDTVAGWDEKKTLKKLKQADPTKVILAIRDRPWCRALTAVKDGHNHVGFTFRDGEVTAIVKDSSAARNGILIHHRLIEINGQNVVGLKDSDIKAIIAAADRSVTITIMPTFVYKHLVQK
jgi:syntenin-1